MSCESKDGEEMAYTQQPLDGDHYRMVRLVVDHHEPEGNYRAEIFFKDPSERHTRFLETGRYKEVPVAIIPEDEIFNYRDEQDRENIVNRWGKDFVVIE